MNIRMRYIPVSGEASEIEMLNATFTKIRALIGAETAEYVYMPANQILIIDEDGLGKGLKLNQVASDVCAGHIVGPAIQVLNLPEDLPYE